MKFDFAIGNPPYNEDFEKSGDNGNFAKPVYNIFMVEAFKVADKVELVHPARFLFNAGSTPKDWNEKMLSDSHFKVLEYEADSTKLFSNADIKGGVVVTYHDAQKEFGEIGTFVVFEELRSVLAKVKNPDFKSFADLVYGRDLYKLTENLYTENSFAENRQSKGHRYDCGSNVFDIFPELFYDKKPDDKNEYAKILGREKNERSLKWFRKDYLKLPDNFNSYKIFIPKSNGSGSIGEVLSTPMVGCTTTFLNIGNFTTRAEAEACMKYIKTKFSRAMLGTLKVTQDNPKPTWQNVPLQDFTPASDIDWTVPIPQIDQQLYKKYKLSPQEINFIKTHVKEMA